MTDGPSRARTTLDAWRERGADRLAPHRFRLIDALERRTRHYSGEVRRLLDARLSGLIEAYADDLARAESKATDAEGATTFCAGGRGPLGALVDYIAQHRQTDEGGRPADSASSFSAYPRLEVLDYFIEISSKVRTERQLRHSLEQVPDNAGPLNSRSLVYRSLSLMREVSPEYLQQFVSYVDALSRIEQMIGGGAVTGKDAPRPASGKRNARGKSR